MDIRHKTTCAMVAMSVVACNPQDSTGASRSGSQTSSNVMSTSAPTGSAVSAASSETRAPSGPSLGSLDFGGNGWRKGEVVLRRQTFVHRPNASEAPERIEENLVRIEVTEVEGGRVTAYELEVVKAEAYELGAAVASEPKPITVTWLSDGSDGADIHTIELRSGESHKYALPKGSGHKSLAFHALAHGPAFLVYEFVGTGGQLLQQLKKEVIDEVAPKLESAGAEVAVSFEGVRNGLGARGREAWFAYRWTKGEQTGGCRARVRVADSRLSRLECVNPLPGDAQKEAFTEIHLQSPTSSATPGKK